MGCGNAKDEKPKKDTAESRVSDAEQCTTRNTPRPSERDRTAVPQTPRTEPPQPEVPQVLLSSTSSPVAEPTPTAATPRVKDVDEAHSVAPRSSSRTPPAASQATPPRQASPPPPPMPHPEVAAAAKAPRATDSTAPSPTRVPAASTPEPRKPRPTRVTVSPSRGASRSRRSTASTQIQLPPPVVTQPPAHERRSPAATTYATIASDEQPRDDRLRSVTPLPEKQEGTQPGTPTAGVAPTAKRATPAGIPPPAAAAHTAEKQDEPSARVPCAAPPAVPGASVHRAEESSVRARGSSGIKLTTRPPASPTARKAVSVKAPTASRPKAESRAAAPKPSAGSAVRTVDSTASTVLPPPQQPSPSSTATAAAASRPPATTTVTTTTKPPTNARTRGPSSSRIKPKPGSARTPRATSLASSATASARGAPPTRTPPTSAVTRSTPPAKAAAPAALPSQKKAPVANAATGISHPTTTATATPPPAPAPEAVETATVNRTDTPPPLPSTAPPGDTDSREAAAANGSTDLASGATPLNYETQPNEASEDGAELAATGTAKDRLADAESPAPRTPPPALSDGAGDERDDGRVAVTNGDAAKGEWRLTKPMPTQHASLKLLRDARTVYQLKDITML